MYMIVVGGGRVGYYLTRALLDEGHEVLLVEKEAAICKAVTNELCSICIRGDGCEAATLVEVGTDRADMLIAVTGDDEDNLVACQVAQHIFKVPHTIARIKNPRHRLLFEKLGIDKTVSSTELILAHIEQDLPSHPLVPLLKLSGDVLEMVEVKIPSDSKMVGKKLSALRLPENSLVCLIVGKTKGPYIPSPDTILEAEDEVVAVTESGVEDKLRSALTGL